MEPEPPLPDPPRLPGFVRSFARIMIIAPGATLWLAGMACAFREGWLLADDMTSALGDYGHWKVFGWACVATATGYGIALFGRFIETLGRKSSPQVWLAKVAKGFALHPLALATFFTGVAAYRAHYRMAEETSGWTIAFAFAALTTLGFLIWSLKGAGGQWNSKVPARSVGIAAVAILAALLTGPSILRLPDALIRSSRRDIDKYLIGLLLVSAAIFVFFFVKKLIVNRRLEAKENRSDPRTTD